MEPQITYPPQLFIILRHAQRADDPSLPHDLRQSNKQRIILECDPQLSRPTGKQQAIQTASHLLQILTNQFKIGSIVAGADVHIYSSPSLTALESASAVACALKRDVITVKDELADVLMKTWYKEDPFPGWTNKLTAKRQLFEEFLLSEYKTPISIEYERSGTGGATTGEKGIK